MLKGLADVQTFAVKEGNLVAGAVQSLVTEVANMTWIVGASTLFGYGVVISDVQVTCPMTGVRLDVLQKARHISDYVVAGFAGDVFAGIELLNDLESFLNVPPVPDDECWDPQWIADNWPTRARGLFTRLSRLRSITETHVLMLGLQQTHNALGNAKGHLSVFRSPDFHPETKLGGRNAMSIGCGAQVSRYTNALRELMFDVNLTYMKAEIGSIGGYGHVIAEVLRRNVAEHPTDGISEHFQLFVVQMGEIVEFGTSGLPKLTRSWSELCSLFNLDTDSHALIA